jgi:uncharacterized protein with von Willebrand factor type A (vWA) domain
MTSRYARWDGSQDPFGPDIPIDEAVSRLNEHLLEGWDAEWALRRLLEEGMPGRFGGLEELRERLAQLRREQERRGRITDPLEQFRERLEEVQRLEREALARRDDDDARFSEMLLDALPDSPTAQVNELRRYEFTSAEAERAFADLLEEIRRQVLESHMRSVTEAMRNPDPEQMARLKDMVADLNAMLERRAGEDEPTQEEFDDFMRRHGEFFPEQPANLDELLQALANRAAAFSRFMASLTPEQRAELMELAEGLLGDVDLAFEMDRLGANLRMLAPGLRWGEPVEMDGAEPMGLAEGLAAIDELASLEQLEQALSQDYPGASLADIDADRVRQLLGDEAGRDLDRLRQIERALEKAGVVVRAAGRLELTPRGVRKLGERALAKVFERLTLDMQGDHDLPAAGGEGDPTGSARPWQFGDAFRLDIRRTVQNAVVRSGPIQGPVRLLPDDFEVEEAERRTEVATVLLLDMSRSMPLRGHWLPAKRMALALHTLISTMYPEDHLDIVGFSDYARVMSPTELAQLDWEPVYGTNMEHAFGLAGRLLSKHRDATRQVLLVTDGEPTAHLEGEHVFFQWPPVQRTLEKTFAEAARLCRNGATMNVFMLERSPGLTRFVDHLARLVGGRVFSVDSIELGQMIVRDYVTRRR